jgi:Putative transposase DNA-binding domain
LRHRRAAFCASFAKRARDPRFTSRHGKWPAICTRSALLWQGAELTLAKTAAPLRIGWTWPDLDSATLEPSTVSLSCDPGGRWYPSSKTCSTCRHLLASLSLRTRRPTSQWTCAGRGTRHDRDVLAAQNISSAAGLAADACGRHVNRQGSALPRSPVKQEPVGASPQGIPIQQVRECSMPHTAVTSGSCGTSAARQFLLVWAPMRQPWPELALARHVADPHTGRPHARARPVRGRAAFSGPDRARRPQPVADAARER